MFNFTRNFKRILPAAVAMAGIPVMTCLHSTERAPQTIKSMPFAKYFGDIAIIQKPLKIIPIQIEANHATTIEDLCMQLPIMKMMDSLSLNKLQDSVANLSTTKVVKDQHISYHTIDDIDNLNLNELKDLKKFIEHLEYTDYCQYKKNTYKYYYEKKRPDDWLFRSKKFKQPGIAQHYFYSKEEFLNNTTYMSSHYNGYRNYSIKTDIMNSVYDFYGGTNNKFIAFELCIPDNWEINDENHNYKRDDYMAYAYPSWFNKMYSLRYNSSNGEYYGEIKTLTKSVFIQTPFDRFKIYIDKRLAYM